jgi:hypothetical protein
MRKLITLLCSLAIGVAATLGLAAPAHAYSEEITVCNYYLSVDAIEVYNSNAGYSVYVNPGDCAWHVPDTYLGARVDVDVSGGMADVDSWKKKKNSEPWGPCYNNEDQSSNPYSDNNQTSTLYYTYSHTDC